LAEDAVRPNFFIILGLDPYQPWDQAAFERALDDRRSKWSRQRNSGVKTHPDTVAARRNLGLVSKIETVMRDPELRQQEQADARKSREDELRSKRDGFAEKVDLILAKGFLYDVELQTLQAEKEILDANPALHRRLDGAEVRPFNRARVDNDRLDPNIERTLTANLAILAEATLYTVLARVDSGIGENSPRDRLLEAANQLYRQAQNTADKNKPEVGARQQLAGLAMQIFGSDELTRRHNVSMLLAPLDALAGQYEKTLAVVKRLDSRQAERFFRKAAEKRIDLTVAKEYLTSYFVGERNWTVDLPGANIEAALKRLVPCPRCESLNDPEAQSCLDCGRAMRELCPKCGLPVSVAARVCGVCDFPYGQRDWVGYLVEEAETALERKDAVTAADHLRRAEQIWTLSPEHRDALAVRLRQARHWLDRLRVEYEAAVSDIADLMRADRYRAALHRLRSLTVSLPTAEQQIRECEARIRQADEVFWTAERPGLSPEQRAELYLRTLRICADHDQASRRLDQLPPPPPTRLRVDVNEEFLNVQLFWLPPDSPECSSVVVRKEGLEAPISAVEMPGQHCVRLDQSAWVDPDPLIGGPVRYAVYTQRRTVLSAQAAIAPTVVFLTRPPEFVTKSGDNEVELSWVLPPRASGAEIVREEPGTAAEPTYLMPTERRQTRLLDKNVRNGVRYRYTIRAQFADPARVDGQPRYSAAVVREATPSPPPEPPGRLYARGGPPPPRMPLYAHRVTLRWPVTGPDDIRIIRDSADSSLRFGDDFAFEQLARYAPVLKGQPPLHDHWIHPDSDLCQYFPVLVQDDRCYVGHPRRYASGPEISGLTAEFLSTSVRVSWTWPATGDEALIAWDEEAELPDPVAAPLQARVARNGQEQTGRFDIPVRAARQLFVLVAVVVRAHGFEFVTRAKPPACTAQVPLFGTRSKPRAELPAAGPSSC
jgi:Double zinc ribbon